MKWAKRIAAAFLGIWLVIALLRALLVPREVSQMLQGLSPAVAKDIGELCYAEGYSEGEGWYHSLENRHGEKQMLDALLALAVVPNEKIANCAISILARKGDDRAATVLSKIAADNASTVSEQARWAAGKLKERGIRPGGRTDKSKNGGGSASR